MALSPVSRSSFATPPPSDHPAFLQKYVDDYHEYGPDLDMHAHKLYMHLRNRGHDRIANLFMSSYEGLEAGYFTAASIGPALVNAIVGMNGQEKESANGEGIAERMVGGVLETVSEIPGSIFGAYKSVKNAADLSPREFAHGFSPLVRSSVAMIGMAHTVKGAKELFSAHGSKLLSSVLKRLA